MYWPSPVRGSAPNGTEMVPLAVAGASERRLAFLAEASAVLASSLEWQATLEQVARLAVPFWPDYCVINVVETVHACAGWRRRMQTPRNNRWSSDSGSSTRPRLDEAGGAGDALGSVRHGSIARRGRKAAAAFPNREHREDRPGPRPRSYMSWRCELVTGRSAP